MSRMRLCRWRKRMRIHLYARARTTVFPGLPFARCCWIVIFRPGARSERMHGPMPQTFAAEGSDKPSANAPNVVCRCWPSTGAIPLYHCHLAGTLIRVALPCLAQRSVVGLAPYQSG